ncbi:FecR family protein [Flavivirga sp. 57AJ16]|uniref:FecR family protein n=1 Tax=Flavivirga sp. 57AJ16 TaxID=3025307 RepID=UPI002365BFEA|nr:FecR family protein [Flavivirga sp. 57AJ16]MDD7885250.1 DUF4974 domain-containing protein [Flavivirga sp. 57AJ16]
MTQKSLEHIIIKYLNNESSESELNDLVLWLENKENLNTFKEYLEINYTLNKDLIFDSLKAYNSTLKTPTKVKAIPFYKRNIFKYAVAASVVLLISLTFIFNKDDTKVIEPIIVNNNIKIGTDKAKLTLGDGTVITLEKGQEYIADNLESNGKEIIYKASASAKPEIEYNYLTVPRGGQYFVKLSDGTQVWLNSESQLKYPVAFVEGKTREVELVYGEAYFEVTNSTEHKGSHFKVYSNNQEVEVLGTEFNIKAYKNETHVYTTLAEGKVTVNHQGKTQTLVPGQQSNLDISTNNLTVHSVDVNMEVSWKDSIFIFRGKALKKIMAVLSRWYDMDVIYENPDLENIPFKGVLGKNQAIENILSAIKGTGVINNYEIHDKTIVLK